MLENLKPFQFVNDRPIVAIAGIHTNMMCSAVGTPTMAVMVRLSLRLRTE